MVVVDASVIVDVVFRDERATEALARRALHAPVTVDAEVLHAIRRKWLAKLIGDEVASTAIDAFRDLEITRHPVQPLLVRMWSFRQNITAYDAGYVALAELLKFPLLTRDWRLAHSSGHTATIEYIA